MPAADDHDRDLAELEPARRPAVYAITERLLELLLADVAEGADPLVKLAEVHEHATRYPDAECRRLEPR